MSKERVINSIKDLKVGDTVVIKDDLVANNNYNNIYFAEEMEWYKNNPFTIRHTQVLYKNIGVVLPAEPCLYHDDDSEDNDWAFSDSMIDWDATREANGVTNEEKSSVEYVMSIPTKQRGFELVSPAQWISSIPQDVDSEQWEQLYNELKLPKRGTKHSSGYDFFSPFEFTLEPNEDIKIPTGIKSYMLEDEYLAIHTRSSLGFKYYSRLANVTGIVDSDYFNNENNEGLIYIKIRNEGDKQMTIKKGEAIAQGIFQKFLLADDDSFDEGETRKGGIGSTN